jgi:hypothetical protein
MVEEIKMTRTQYNSFVDKLTKGIGNDLVNALVRRVAVDTGNLKNSIKAQTEGRSVVISMSEYAPYVEFGTPPHVIRPKNAKALHWKADGVGPRGGKIKTDVFAKVVHHPGTRPQPFIRPAIRDDLPGIIVDNIRRHAQ